MLRPFELVGEHVVTLFAFEGQPQGVPVEGSRCTGVPHDGSDTRHELHIHGRPPPSVLHLGVRLGYTHSLPRTDHLCGQWVLRHVLSRPHRFPHGAAQDNRYTTVTLHLTPELGVTHTRDLLDEVDHTAGRPLEAEKRTFWTSHSRLGYLILTAESLFVLGYFLATPRGPHRLALTVVISVTLVAAAAAMAYIVRVSKQPWRVSFSLASTLVAGAALTLCIFLDGGLDSPLMVLIALPIMSAALALPAREVALCGVAAFVEFGVVAPTDSHVEASAVDVAALFAFLIGTFVLSVGSAVYRSRLERDEDHLVLELHRQASTDSLTGCLDHRVFYERLDVEVEYATRHGEQLSVLVADVDLFKSFNGAHGHAAGDAALAEAGVILRRTSRSIDTVARIGGDEFAVILPRTDLVSAGNLAEQMIRAIADGEADITMSIGFAALDRLEPTSQRVFRDADLGLYRAKANGRARTGTIGDVATSVPARTRDSRELADPVFAQADWDRLEESLRESNRATVQASSIIDSLQSTASVGFGYVDREFPIRAHECDARVGPRRQDRGPDRPPDRRCRPGVVADPRADLPARHRQRRSDRQPRGVGSDGHGPGADPLLADEPQPGRGGG